MLPTPFITGLLRHPGITTASQRPLLHFPPFTHAFACGIGGWYYGLVQLPIPFPHPLRHQKEQREKKKCRPRTLVSVPISSTDDKGRVMLRRTNFVSI